MKPAGQTAFLTEAVVREIIASGLLPEGSLQLLCARPDGLLDHLTGQDTLSVTGSHQTATALRMHPVVAANAVRYTAEADSVNSSILGPDGVVGTQEFDLFVKTVAIEMTQKTGQKCTAIRRAFVPTELMDDVEQAIADRLSKVTVGNPTDDSVRMGPVVSSAQRDTVRSAVARLEKSTRRIFGDPDRVPENFSPSADATVALICRQFCCEQTTPWPQNRTP